MGGFGQFDSGVRWRRVGSGSGQPIETPKVANGRDGPAPLTKDGRMGWEGYVQKGKGVLAR